MFAQNVFQPGKEKRLDYIASIHCDPYVYWKDDGKEWSKKMDEAVLWEYNCQDCCYTFEAAESLEHCLKQSGLWSQFQTQMRLFEPVLKMEIRGIRSDPAARQRMSAELEKAITLRTAGLEVMFGHPVNPRSPDQLVKLFYHDFGLPEIRSRKTGAPTVDDDALEQIKLRDPLFYKACTYIQQIRTLSIMKKTFVEAKGPGDTIYTSFNPAGTSTFRFSSSTNPIGWGTNAQNVKKHVEDDPFQAGLPDVRSLYKPRPGYTWVKVDLVKADLHVVVWEAKETELKQLLASGINIYRNAVDTGTVSMPYVKAKSFIHGTDYGGSPRTMAVNCKISVQQAESAQRAWFGRYPGIKRWHERVKDGLFKHRTVYNKFGYRRYFHGRVESLVPEALAWGPQSTVGHVINFALLNIDRQFDQQDVRLLLQVHDELDMEVRTDKLDVLLPEIVACCKIVVPYDEPLVIPVDIEISPISWGDVKPWRG